MKDIKHIRQDYHLAAWVMHAQGVGLGGTMGGPNFFGGNSIRLHRSAKKCILNSFWIFPILLLIYLYTLLLCIFNSECWILFQYTIRMSNSLEPDQALHLGGPDLAPNCLERLSADDKSHH